MVASATCGVPVVRQGKMVFCGEPAAFRYAGLITPRQGETQQVALQRRGQIILDECMDHSRETFMRMEPALREGTATMRCVVHTRLTIHCQSCKSLFRFEPLPPTTVQMPGRFCPNCGSNAVARFDPTLDYWEIISESLGLDSANFTAALHSIWMKDPTATKQFVEYIQDIMAELGA